MFRLACTAVLCCVVLHAQGRGPRISAADVAILDDARTRRDFPCTVRSIRPELGFDLRLHAGGYANIRPAPGRLRVVTRVTPAGGRPVYLPEGARIPELAELRDKRLAVNSRFALGEGAYRVDWLARDQAGGVCSAHWDVEAKLPRRARGVSLIAPGLVQPESLDPFRREPRATASRQGLRVKLLVNFASRSVSTAVLEPRNLDPLLAVLRALSRDTRIATFSVVGFLLSDQRVFYRQGEAAEIDFPAMGTALKSMELGTVQYERLIQERSQEWFLADLLKAEAGGAERPNALIIVGPRVWTKGDIPSRDLKKMGPLGYPVFYLKCGPFRPPRPGPYRPPEPFDAIARLIGIFRGREYRILAPAEIGYAARDAVDRMARSRAAPEAASGL